MKKVVWISITLLNMLLFLQAQNPGSEIFITPENLKDNVGFWKKIYTEVSLSEGLFHDREYPMVIYKKIAIGKLRGRSRRYLLRSHIKKISESLKTIIRKKESQWGEEERRIAGLYRTHGDIKRIKSARQRIRFQQGQKERFKEGLERSGLYMDFILSVLKKYNIPERIAYLPHVESSFNPAAYSKVGAAGMWQFMRPTGRLYMRIDYRIDERRDPFRSTIAAAKHLRSNYEQLKSWPLAITAYNHGLASIKRAVRVTKSRDLGVIIEKYRNRRFKFASKNFYGCFLAASEICQNASNYFPNLIYLQPIETNELKLTSFIKPSTLARHLGITQEELGQLNPALRSTVFRRQLTIPRGFNLKIPGSISAETAREKITKIPASLKTSASKDLLYYSVKRGDNLYRISRKFKVPAETLINVNNIGREDHIYIGQILRIPQNGSTKSYKAVSVVKENSHKPKQVKKAIPTTPPQIKPKEIESAVQPPDPLKNRNFRETEKFDSTLYPLKIMNVSPERGTARITVGLNETLGHYADWLQISTSRIRRLNRIYAGNIRVNQKITIPATTSSLERFNRKRLEYHMALEEDFYNQYQVTDIQSKKVKRGETLWSICNNDNEIPLWLFKKYNRDVNLSKIRTNTKIKLPIVKNK